MPLLGGVIGQIESSISYEYVKDYTFTNPLAAVKLYTKEVKGLGADMVVVAIHDQNESFNQAVSLFIRR